MSTRLPVTVIGGFLGAGKTSFLHEAISTHQGGHLAVLLENVGALNLDAKAIRGLCGAMRRLQDTVLEIIPGDEEIQTAWILARLNEFSVAGRYERVLIEAAGISNPAQLAQRIDQANASGFAIAGSIELSQIICIADALELSRGGADLPNEMGLREFQNEQIKGATLVVLNKCDLITDEGREHLMQALHRDHPGARLIETAYGEMPAEIWSQGVSRVDLDSAFARRLESLHKPSASPDLAVALYRVHRPFHPERFWTWFNAEHPRLLRVKGIIWLATRNLLVGGISRTRWQNACGTAGIWWAALPREDWPQEQAALLEMQETWREPYGDRRQELVLIGDAAELSGSMRRKLDACLLTDAEFAQPFKAWEAFPDPFPAWDLEG